MATVNIYDMADTWNDVGTTFTAIKMDVTNTNSAAGSLLFDLQVGSSSRFAITKDGNVSLGEDVAAPDTRTISAQSVITGTLNTAGQDFTIQGSAGTGSGAGGSIIFQVAPAGTSGTGQNTLEQFAEITSGRVLNLYNTFTDASNYERLQFGYSTSAVDIQYQNLGSGSARYLRLKAPNQINFNTGGSDNWSIQGSHILAQVDGTSDIGESSANRPRTIYLTDNVVTGATDFIHETSAALTDGAGANTATLANAPSAGNPTKWIAINDNGTTRYIPTWE